MPGLQKRRYGCTGYGYRYQRYDYGAAHRPQGLTHRSQEALSPCRAGPAG